MLQGGGRYYGDRYEDGAKLSVAVAQAGVFADSIFAERESVFCKDRKRVHRRADAIEIGQRKRGAAGDWAKDDDVCGDKCTGYAMQELLGADGVADGG